MLQSSGLVLCSCVRVPRNGPPKLLEQSCSRPGSSEHSLFRVPRNCLPKARRTHIPFRIFGTYFICDSLWLLMRTQRQTSTCVSLRRSPKAGGRFVCSVTHPKSSLAFWEFCLAIDSDTRFIALDFAFTVGESSERPWDLFDITTLCFLFERNGCERMSKDSWCQTDAKDCSIRHA